MDNDLDAVSADGVRMHLATCPPCAKVCEDFTAILDVCKTESTTELVTPNSQALWCRISNVIESEIKPPAVEPVPRRRLWRLTLPQLATAVIAVAVISSLLTVVGIRNYIQPTGEDFTTRSAATQTTFEKVLSKIGLMETPSQARDRHLKEQQTTINYWNERVQSRRVQWDPRTRDTFDRNLQVIDQSLTQYISNLQEDPEDDLSSEMLDSVLNDKMNLLRDFSDL